MTRWLMPLYLFVPKGKDELADYRVPLARLLQERKEEARLLPGTRRMDDTVYNIPRLGKNYVRAMQHRDLLAIRPDGSRVYEFHPWEKKLQFQNNPRCRAQIEFSSNGKGDYRTVGGHLDLKVYTGTRD